MFAIIFSSVAFPHCTHSQVFLAVVTCRCSFYVVLFSVAQQQRLNTSSQIPSFPNVYSASFVQALSTAHAWAHVARTALACLHVSAVARNESMGYDCAVARNGP